MLIRTLCCLWLLVLCVPEDGQAGSVEDLACLRQAYPDAIVQIRRVEGGRTVLVMRNGLYVVYSRQGAVRTRQEILDQGTVQESMATRYPLGDAWSVGGITRQRYTGRSRSYSLLKALYGGSQQAVERQLETVQLMGQSVTVSQRVAPALREVARELAELVTARPELAAYMTPASGYLWRGIAGAARLSPHSFGIAVDLNPEKGPYWRWAGKGVPHPGKEAYPAAIVDIFERHGFIWGGKWREYDMMHFEYRPELVCKARMGGKATVDSDAEDAPQTVESGADENVD